jgi:predicted nucleic acid-binding protein
VILIDTSGLLAAIDGSERLHRAAAAALRQAESPRSLSPFVLAELDYLLTTRVSQDAARRLLGEVGRGAYQLESFDAGDVALAGSIMDRYRDLDLGLADASILVLAERHDTRDILTLDERHFRGVRDMHGRPLRILPADVRAKGWHLMEDAVDYA